MAKISGFKWIKVFLKIAWWIALALLVSVLITVIGAKVKGKVPKLFGYSVMHVISDSMEPTIKKDSYILIKEIDAGDVKKDDIICFYSPDPLIYGLPNTHRVINEPIMTEDGIFFETQGDKSVAPDTIPIKGERLIGVYVKELSALGKLSNALNGGLALVLILIIQLGIVVIAVCTAVTTKKNSEKD